MQMFTIRTAAALVSTLMLHAVVGISEARADRIVYIHTDHLGSPIAETDEQGRLIRRFTYEPYGARVGGEPISGPGYTGHVVDLETDLLYMQQRYYDPYSGRFLSIDPVDASQDHIDAFNRYRYANGNPLRFIDPDGRTSIDARILGRIDRGEPDPGPRPVPTPPAPTPLPRITVTAERPPTGQVPTFLTLTTTSALRRDTSTAQAIEAGRLARAVTLPTLTVTAAAPLAGAGLLSGGAISLRGVSPLATKETVYWGCMAVALCTGGKMPYVRNTHQQQTQQIKESAVRGTSSRRDVNKP